MLIDRYASRILLINAAEQAEYVRNDRRYGFPQDEHDDEHEYGSVGLEKISESVVLTGQDGE